MKAVLLGATKGMGRALARQMATRGDTLFLLGRSQDDLSRSAADLEIRSGQGKVGSAHCDLLDEASFEPALSRAEAELQGFDTVIVTAGSFADQDTLENDPEGLSSLLRTNLVGTIGFCELARKRLLASGGGTLCVFSSVAGDRARKPVILYDAHSKGAVAYLNLAEEVLGASHGPEAAAAPSVTGAQ